MKLQLFRLSLLARDQAPLLSTAEGYEKRTRRDFLIWAFSQKWEIDRYHNRPVTYYPGKQEGDLIMGHIARKSVEDHFDGPDTGFSPKAVEYWEKSAVILNLEKDQQVIGVQYNEEIGSPRSRLNEIILKINAASGPNDYKIDFFPLHAKRNFYEAVERQAEPVTTIEFTYVVPNVFGGSGEVKKALEKYKDGAKARTVKIALNNPAGLDVKDPLIEEGVEYVAKGGGEVKAKVGKRVVYDSSAKQEVTTLTPSEEESVALENGDSPPARMKAKLQR